MVRSPFDHSCVPGIMNLAASPEDVTGWLGMPIFSESIPLT